MVNAAPFADPRKLVGLIANGASAYDTVIITGLGAEPAAGSIRRRGGLPVIAGAAMAEHAARRPAGITRLIAELRQQKLLQHRARVVAVTSPHGVAALYPPENRELARAAQRALEGAIQDIALAVSAPELVVTLVTDCWGQQDGAPVRHRYPVSVAASLRGTIERLQDDRHGRAVDLTGAPLPEEPVKA